jgi:pimeloyl-ACP methyl ester carboxylesterase
MRTEHADDLPGRSHEASIGGRRLHVWEKPAAGEAVGGTILFVHGSSMSSQPTFDLRVDGMPQASPMNWFASRGFDTWTFDCRGYGRSCKDDAIIASISDGADDIAAVADLVRDRSGADSLMVYGISSGALRAALYAERHPGRVARLALDAMVWTGRGSPTLAERARKLDQWRASPRRPLDREFLMSIFTRDHAGTADERIIAPFIDQVLEHDDSIPNGTYIDMCANLPVCDPQKITAPTIIMRGEYDGIASLEDLLDFYARLPSPDKEFAMMPGIAHASFTQKNLMRVYHILHSFFTRPEPVYRGR